MRTNKLDLPRSRAWEYVAEMWHASLVDELAACRAEIARLRAELVWAREFRSACIARTSPYEHEVTAESGTRVVTYGANGEVRS